LLYVIADIWLNKKDEIICKECNDGKGGMFLRKQSKVKQKISPIKISKFVAFQNVCNVLYDPTPKLKVKRKHITLIEKTD